MMFKHQNYEIGLFLLSLLHELFLLKDDHCQFQIDQRFDSSNYHTFSRIWILPCTIKLNSHLNLSSLDFKIQRIDSNPLNSSHFSLHTCCSSFPDRKHTFTNSESHQSIYSSIFRLYPPTKPVNYKSLYLNYHNGLLYNQAYNNTHVPCCLIQCN